MALTDEDNFTPVPSNSNQIDSSSETTEVSKTTYYAPTANGRVYNVPFPNEFSEAESLRAFQLYEMAAKQALDKPIGIIRGFPTFKFYAIDENKAPYGGGAKNRVSSAAIYYDITDWVIEARLIKSRKNPVDFLVITLDDNDGYLSGKAGYWKSDMTESRNTEKSNDLLSSGGLIRDGVAVEFRLGYDNNENTLETVFIGQIASVVGTDVLTVEAQSWATELLNGAITPEEGTIKDGVVSPFNERGASDYGLAVGVGLAAGISTAALGALAPVSAIVAGKIMLDAMTTGEASTSNVIRYLFRGSQNSFNVTATYGTSAPLEHFGKATMVPVDEDVTIVPDNRFGLSDSVAERTVENMYIQRVDSLVEDLDNWDNKMKLFPSISMDSNAPDERTEDTAATRDVRLKFNLYMMTLWDVLKTLARRHPGWIVRPVPYRTHRGTEMTIFFGPPIAPYIWVGPGALQLATNFMRTNGENDLPPLAERGVRNAAEGASEAIKAGFDIAKDFLFPGSKRPTDVLNFRRKALTPTSNLRPFKRFHLATSTSDIILNNISADAEGTFNSVKVYYLEDECGLDPGGNITNKEDLKVIEVKADDNILPADTRVAETQEHNACLESIAVKMGLSYLEESLKDLYKGELILVGNEKINPYDTIILADTYTGMFGPIDVEEVEHVIGKDIGFVTNVTPDLVVTTGDFEGLVVTSSVVKFLLGLFIKIELPRSNDYPFKDLTEGLIRANRDTGITTATLPAAFGPAYFTLAQMGILLTKAAMWWRSIHKSYREPVVAMPLIKNGEPYLVGLKGYNRNSNLTLVTVEGMYEATRDYIKQIEAEEMNRQFFGDAT